MFFPGDGFPRGFFPQTYSSMPCFAICEIIWCYTAFMPGDFVAQIAIYFNPLQISRPAIANFIFSTWSSARRFGHQSWLPTLLFWISTWSYIDGLPWQMCWYDSFAWLLVATCFLSARRAAKCQFCCKNTKNMYHGLRVICSILKNIFLGSMFIRFHEGCITIPSPVEAMAIHWTMAWPCHIENFKLSAILYVASRKPYFCCFLCFS